MDGLTEKASGPEDLVALVENLANGRKHSLMDRASMSDPIVKAIQGGIIGVCLSDPATSGRLSRFELRQDNGISGAVQIEGGVLYYNREHVKRLTVAGLKEALAAVLKFEQ